MLPNVRYIKSNGRVSRVVIDGNLRINEKMKLPLPSGHYAIFKAIEYNRNTNTTTLVRIKTIRSLDNIMEKFTV